MPQRRRSGRQSRSQSPRFSDKVTHVIAALSRVVGTLLACWSGDKPRLLEALKEAGLSRMLLTQHPHTLGERIRAVFPLAEGSQVHQQGDCFVVVTRLLGVDEVGDQFPGRVFSRGELVQVPVVGFCGFTGFTRLFLGLLLGQGLLSSSISPDWTDSSQAR